MALAAVMACAAGDRCWPRRRWPGSARRSRFVDVEGFDQPGAASRPTARGQPAGAGADAGRAPDGETLTESAAIDAAAGRARIRRADSRREPDDPLRPAYLNAADLVRLGALSDLHSAIIPSAGRPTRRTSWAERIDVSTVAVAAVRAEVGDGDWVLGRRPVGARHLCRGRCRCFGGRGGLDRTAARPTTAGRYR